MDVYGDDLSADAVAREKELVYTCLYRRIITPTLRSRARSRLGLIFQTRPL